MPANPIDFQDCSIGISDRQPVIRDPPVAPQKEVRPVHDAEVRFLRKIFGDVRPIVGFDRAIAQLR
jgi:hypothetical protein